MSDEEAKAALKAGGGNLKFLLAREGVGEVFQAKLFHVGVTSVQSQGAACPALLDHPELAAQVMELLTELANYSEC